MDFTVSPFLFSACWVCLSNFIYIWKHKMNLDALFESKRVKDQKGAFSWSPLYNDTSHHFIKYIVRSTKLSVGWIRYLQLVNCFAQNNLDWRWNIIVIHNYGLKMKKTRGYETRVYLKRHITLNIECHTLSRF